MDSEDFFRVMLFEYPTEKNTSDSSLEERFRQIDKKLFKIDLKNPKCYNALFLQVMKIMEVEDAIPVNEKRVTDLCSILTNKIGKDNTLNKQMWEHMSVKTFKPTSINEWFERTRAEMRRLYGAMVCLESYGVKIGSDNNNHDRTKHDDKPKYKQDKLDKKEDKFPQSTKRNYEKLTDEQRETLKAERAKKLCNVCGRKGHTKHECKFIADKNNTHPDANTTSAVWAESAKGRAWKEKGQETLPSPKNCLEGLGVPQDRSLRERKLKNVSNIKCTHSCMT